MMTRLFSSYLLLFVFGLSTKAQIITTISGTPGLPGITGNGGPAGSALFYAPHGIAVDKNGEIYIADWFSWGIRKINNAGFVSRIAGTGIPGYSGDGGNALNAQFNAALDIDVDGHGNVYICDLGNYRVRKINSQGIITTVAGNGTSGNGLENGVGDGGPAITAPIYDAKAVAVDADGNMYIAEPAKNSIRKVYNNGILSTVAGQGLLFAGYSGDGGPASLARLNVPSDITIDNAGNIFIADLGNHVIRKINPQGIISTYAGTGIAGYSGDGGPATSAKLFRPCGIATDNQGNIYIAEDGNHIIRKVNSAGIITTVAGTGVMGYSGDGGPANAAKLSIPQYLSVDNSGNIYLTDWVNHTVRKITVCKDIVSSSVSISVPVASFCAGTQVTFTAIPVNEGTNPQYQWLVNGNNAGLNKSSFTTTSLADGDVISCTLTSSITCTVPVISVNSIRVTVKTLPVIVLPSDYFVNPGNSVQITPLVTGNISSLNWSPPTGLNNPLVANPVASPQTTTAYTLKVKSTNGCEAEATTTVKVFKRLLMPSAFTPNNDGLNDIFRIPPGTTMNLKSFSVYDRWGNTVFKTTDINKGWDGRNNGAILPTGIYVYIVEGSDLKGNIFAKGTVLLIK